MLVSSEVAAGQTALAQQYNDLRTDVLNSVPVAFAADGNVIFGALGTTVGGFFVDDKDYMLSTLSSERIRVYKAGGDFEERTFSTDFTSATDILGMAQIGSYLYVLGRQATTLRVYRYDVDDLASGGTLMTASFFGASSCRMTSNGTDLFFTNDAGDDAANDHEILRASISGTTLTEEEVITCGSTSGLFNYFLVDSSVNIYAYDDGGDDLFRKFNSSGVLQKTSTQLVSGNGMYAIGDNLYFARTGSGVMYFTKIPI